MNTMRLFDRLLLVLPLLTACAGGPTFDTSRVDRSLTPRGVAAEQQWNTGKSVLWGGVILSISNLKDRTQLEVLAYPLDAENVPQRDSEPLGRFIIERTGYLEPATYAEGRLLSVVGTLARGQAGRVGESDYSYPVITGEQLYLWPRNSVRDRTSVHFGIGVGIGF